MIAGTLPIFGENGEGRGGVDEKIIPSFSELN
jgi:hypothetical protein